ncbi:MAG: alpha/beta hydrolase, partial [Tsuneonella sp.]
SYLTPVRPSGYGEHLTWLWNRMLEQSWFFPWFEVRDETRLSVAHADAGRVHAAVMEMLDAGDAYRAGYGAVLRAPRDIPAPDSITPPVLITAYQGDPLCAHIERLGEMPPNWHAHAVATPAEHERESLGFLRRHATDAPARVAEDANGGWLTVGEGLIHWRGERDAERMVLHAPAAEMTEPGPGEVAIDVPGHGLSSDFADMAATIEAVRDALGARHVVWPGVPAGHPDQLYPNLVPDRFGSHLQRAWSAARAEALFRPWYAADRDHALPVDPAALDPDAIARRVRARLRAGDAARRFHRLLSERTGDPA